jgi:hypothetical protein
MNKTILPSWYIQIGLIVGNISTSLITIMKMVL